MSKCKLGFLPLFDDAPTIQFDGIDGEWVSVEEFRRKIDAHHELLKEADAAKARVKTALRDLVEEIKCVVDDDVLADARRALRGD